MYCDIVVVMICAAVMLIRLLLFLYCCSCVYCRLNWCSRYGYFFVSFSWIPLLSFGYLCCLLYVLFVYYDVAGVVVTVAVGVIVISVTDIVTYFGVAVAVYAVMVYYVSV